MSDIELPDLPPLKTVAWQITNDDISYWTAVRDRSAASAIKDEHELAGFPDSTMAALVLRSDAEAAILADREKRAQTAQGWSHWEARIKQLMEGLGQPNSRSLYQAFSQLVNEMAQASKPVQAEAPTACPHGTPHRWPCDQCEAPTASNERLTDDEVFALIDKASAEFRRSQSRVRGNMVMPSDDPKYVLVRVVETALATQQEAQPQAEPFARIEFRRGTPGKENDMPTVVSCNWLPDGVYEVYLASQAEPAGGDKEDADKYRLIRRGQHWSVIDAIGNTLRGDDLDAAVDAARAAQQATGERG